MTGIEISISMMSNLFSFECLNRESAIAGDGCRASHLLQHGLDDHLIDFVVFCDQYLETAVGVIFRRLIARRLMARSRALLRLRS